MALGSGFCPHADVAAQATNAQRYEVIERSFRESKPAPIPLLTAEAAWTVKLSVPPSAGGAMDEQRVYIPLRDGLLVSLDREMGTPVWARPIETSAPPVTGGGMVFIVSAGSIAAIDGETGDSVWWTRVGANVTAPLVWDNGWLIALVEPGEVFAFRAADGHLVWRRSVGVTSPHAAVPGGKQGLYVSLSDGRVVALAISSGELMWERKLPGTLSPPAVGKDRVFVGSTNNFFYAFDVESGHDAWRWRNGGDVIGASVDGDVVYFASLDNIIRAVNRGNGNQRWRKTTGTRPLLPPRAFRGVVLLPGMMPAITVFVGETGAVMGTHAAQGDLAGPPLVDPAPKPFSVAFITITREGVVEALRPTALMFRETPPIPVAALPGRVVTRERME